MLKAAGTRALASAKEENIFLVRNAAHHVSERAYDALGVISDLLLVKISFADEYDVVRNALYLELSLFPVVAGYDGSVNEGVVIRRLKCVWLRPRFQTGLRFP